MSTLHLAVGLLALAGACQAAEETPRLGLVDRFDAARAKPTGTKATTLAEGKALRLDVGHAMDWPGIVLAPDTGTWNVEAYERICLDVKNVGQTKATLACRVDNTGADGVNHCNTANLTLEPGAGGTLTVTLRRIPPTVPDVKLFGMRGYPFGQDTKGSIDARKVTQLVVFVPKPTAASAWEISDARAEGRYSAPPPPPAKDFLPFIDTFGQYIHRDWPGKVHSLDELRARVAEEAKDLAARAGPTGWNKWGGWADGPQLEATGFFRVTKHEGKWWLVDPDGRLFWSHGIDCVGAMHATPTDERETWWRDFPGAQADLAEFTVPSARALHGHYAGRNVKAYSFSFATLKRKYGADWKTQWYALAHRRLRSWGLNTIGNWSQGAVKDLRQTPYTATIHFGGKLLEGSQGYWGKFRDVFDPEFATQLKAALAKEKGKAAGDPWCLGFFVDNEIAWGDDTSLAIAALVSPAEQKAKQVFLADLRGKYETVDKLNAAWGTTHASWEALAASRTAPDRTKARADLTAFYTKTAETYFRTIRDAVKEVAPKQLYLGCRFAWVNDLAAKAGGKFCDVVSYNFYRRGIADIKTPAGDVPLIVGEFHFGALDRGLFHTGLVSVASQDERAKSYRDYVRGALRHPQFVGTHWFEYQDEPVTGRALDEENYQIGFLDPCDTPYPETVNAAREVGYDLYRYRLAGK
jgi:hypothetical protein